MSSAESSYHSLIERLSPLDSLQRLILLIKTTAICSLFIVVFALLLGVGQFKDILLEQHSLIRAASFLVGLVFFSLTCSAVARFILLSVTEKDYAFANTILHDGHPAERWLEYLPILYLLLPGIILVLIAGFRGLYIVSGLGLLSIIISVGLVKLKERMVARAEHPALAAKHWYRRAGQLLILFWLLTSMIAFTIPFKFGASLGGAATAFIALGTILFSFTLLGYSVQYGLITIHRHMPAQTEKVKNWVAKWNSLRFLFDRRYPVPVVTIVFIISMVSSLLWDVAAKIDIHKIQPSQSIEQPAYAYQDLANAWQSFQHKAAQSDEIYSFNNLDQKTIPVFFVVAQGGGLRAAYWSNKVLSHLEEKLPGFHNNIFSVSGVSGGGLGANTYVTALAQTHFLSSESSANGLQLSRPIDQTLGGDHLSGVVTAFLFGDLFRHFVPLPLGYNRGDVLEQSWQTSYARAFGHNNSSLNYQLSDGLQSLYHRHHQQHKDRWLPLAITNGFHQQLAQRVVTAPFPVEPPWFVGKLDFFEQMNWRSSNSDTSYVLQNDISLSTAALNSARFPYVTAAGSMPSGQIVDGGYFENYGSLVTQDMIAFVNNGEHSLYSNTRFVPIVMIIANDEELSWQTFDTAIYPSQPKTPSFMNGLLSPIKSFMATRSGHTRYQLQQMLIQQKNSVEKYATPSFETELAYCINNDCTAAASQRTLNLINTLVFRLERPVEADEYVPLGWSLSEHAQNTMNQAVDSKNNQLMIGQLCQTITLNNKTNSCDL